MLSRFLAVCCLFVFVSALPGCGESEPTSANNGVAPQPTAEDTAGGVKPQDKKGAMMAPKG
jgi:hypothetical protein